ncbi:MAG: FecR family protein [Bdellovibrionales bacterium]|nr:FecR family protein [Bdellovibrionales bacterium]
MRFLILFLLISFKLHGADQIGTVAVIIGEANITREGKSEPIVKNQEIFEKDKINAKENGFVKALLKDDSIVTIGSNSDFVFSQFKIENKNSRKVDLKLQKGKVRLLITKKLRKGFIKLKTKSLTMGVRGTEFLVSSQIVDGQEVTSVGVISGVVSVEPAAGVKLRKEVDVVFLRKGEMLNSTDLTINGADAIKPIAPKIIEELKSDKGRFLPEVEVNKDEDETEIEDDGTSKGEQDTTKTKSDEDLTTDKSEAEKMLNEARTEQKDVVENMETTVEELDIIDEETDVGSKVSEVNERVDTFDYDEFIQEQINDRIENLDLEGLDPRIRKIIEDTLNKQ